MSKIAASLVSLGGAIGQAFVQSASGQQYNGAPQQKRKKKGCTPCEAMARVDAARAKVRNAGK